MRGMEQPLVFDREWANEIWRFVTEVDNRERAAEQRNAELVRAHREGWQKLANAVEKGLGRIAEAIQGRR